MSSFISRFNPCSHEYHAFKDFKDLDSKSKAITIIATLFTALLTIGIGSVACFRSLVNRFKKVTPEDNAITGQMVKIAKQNIIPTDQEKAPINLKIPQQEPPIIPELPPIIMEIPKQQAPNLKADESLLWGTPLPPIIQPIPIQKEPQPNTPQNDRSNQVQEQPILSYGNPAKCTFYPSRGEFPESFAQAIESRIAKNFNVGLFCVE